MIWRTAGPAALLLSLGLPSISAACSAPSPSPPRPVVIAASDSTRGIADRLGSLYQSRSGGLVNVRPGNAESALLAVRRGEADAAVVDAPLTDTTGLQIAELGREPLAIIANPANPIANASSDLLAQLYGGRLRDWSEVGGPVGPIVLLTREGGDGGRTVLERTMLRGREVSATAIVAPSEAMMLQRVASTVGAIGYVGLGAAGPSVKVVPVDNKPPSLDNGYPLVRPILLVTRSDEGDAAAALREIATSPDGRRAVGGLRP
ncbi:MAG: substrate-binding domain-containing protein [Dehalococcoidia bacterium]